MKRNHIHLHYIALAAIIAIALLLEIGCDSSGTIRPREYNAYRVEGVMVKEPNRNVSTAVVNFTKDSVLVSNAVVTVRGDTLLLDTLQYPYDVYALPLGPADSLLIGATNVTVMDGTSLLDTLPITVPGNLSITSIIPTQKGPADAVHVSWTGAANASGYVIVAVKQDSVFQGMGYAQYVTSGVTSAAINEDAFLKNTLQGPEPNSGIYNIYVYAYNGAPDSTLSARALPVPFPSQLADNIKVTNMDGRLGTVVVSYFGTVEVL